MGAIVQFLIIFQARLCLVIIPSNRIISILLIPKNTQKMG